MCAFQFDSLMAMNRPLLGSDLDFLHESKHSLAIKSLVNEYKNEGLPVMNGGFNYSNLVEGPGQQITCIPYRLWEYESLFSGLDGQINSKARFLDVGGAASPLVYYLAEQGYEVLSIDLQPILVETTNYVADVRSLDLDALVGDITKDFELVEEFDFALCVSVLEHIEFDKRLEALKAMYRALKPGGFLYMTFDYGKYYDNETSYVKHQENRDMVSGSISDIDALCMSIEQAGFVFWGNDPRLLPEEILLLMISPAHKKIMWQRSLNIIIDGHTPWRELAKYLVKRIFHYNGVKNSRFEQHNFFRLYLRKPAKDAK